MAKKLTDSINPCPHCLNDMTVIREEFVFGIIQIECKLKCCVCGFTLKERTTKKAIKKWNRGG
jgi:hypothetical protein